jgi:hypothetical protein
MEQQTLIALVGYIGVFVGSILALASMGVSPIYTVSQSIMWMVNAAIFLYALNCSVVGQCNIYAWIIGYIALGIGIFAFIGGIAAFVNRDSLKTKMQSLRSNPVAKYAGM